MTASAGASITPTPLNSPGWHLAPQCPLRRRGEAGFVAAREEMFRAGYRYSAAFSTSGFRTRCMQPADFRSADASWRWTLRGGGGPLNEPRELEAAYREQRRNHRDRDQFRTMGHHWTREPLPEWFTVTAAATYLGLSVAMVRRLAPTLPHSFRVKGQWQLRGIIVADVATWERMPAGRPQSENAFPVWLALDACEDAATPEKWWAELAHLVPDYAGNRVPSADAGRSHTRVLLCGTGTDVQLVVNAAGDEARQTEGQAGETEGRVRRRALRAPMANPGHYGEPAPEAAVAKALRNDPEARAARAIYNADMESEFRELLWASWGAF